MKSYNFFVNGASDMVLTLTQRLADRPGLLVPVSQGFIKIILAISMTAVLVLLILRLRRKWLIFIPLFAGLLFCGIGIATVNAARAGEMHCIYFTSAKNDGLVLTIDGKSLYIDVSNGSSPIVRKAEYISEIALCPELSGYMITHYHEMHIEVLISLRAELISKRCISQSPKTKKIPLS